jgi:hypothetical protein
VVPSPAQPDVLKSPTGAFADEVHVQMPQLTGVSPELEPGLLQGESSSRVERPERLLPVNTGEQLDGTQPVLMPSRQTRDVGLPRDTGVRKSPVIADIESMRDEVDGDRQLRKRGLDHLRGVVEGKDVAGRTLPGHLRVELRSALWDYRMPRFEGVREALHGPPRRQARWMARRASTAWSPQ